MAKILGVGNSVIDHVCCLNHFPAENSEQRAISQYNQLGGNCANSLNLLAQLGHSASIMTTLAQDETGKQLAQELQKRKVDISLVQKIRGGQTPRSQVWLSQETGSRTIVHYRDLAEVSFDHFAKTEIEQFDWLHFEGRNIEAVAGMLNIARCFLQGQPISLEVEKERDGIDALFSQVSVLFFSQTFVQGRGFTTAEAWLTHCHTLAPQAVIFCAWGDQGAWCVSTEGKIYHQRPTANLTVVDSLGAGDVFNAGVIDAMVRGHQAQEALKLAVLLAEKKLGQLGIDDLFANDQRPVLIHSKEVTPHKVKVVSVTGRKHSIALFRHGAHIKAYDNNCPHANVPLDSMYKIEIDPRALTVKCSVHTAFFRTEDGLCVAGPCERQSLKPTPIVIDDQGWIYLAE